MTNKCQWFLKCNRKSTAEVEHSVLGWVPICERHLVWLTDDPSPTKMVPPLVARRMIELKKRLDSA